jgi:molybdopterin molybdotransferase
MVTAEAAYKIVIESFVETGSEVIQFRDSTGRILAEDITSDMDIPPFNRAAMDGYACNRNDIGSELDVIEVIQAGQVPRNRPGKNQCSKIMTGAIIPEGCDCVFIVEESKVLPSGKVIFTGKSIKINFSERGEDVREGDIVLRRGKLIKPQDIAVMSSVGHTMVRVGKKPSTGVISTGDELVEPDTRPGLSQIRNSNAYQLLAQVERAGASGKYYGIAPDNEEITFNIISRAIAENDIVILTGGVSMGDFDFVPSVLKRAGVKLLFTRIRVQPGKPTSFGVHPDSLVFGLPGNPVSSFIQFEILIRPLINKMMGYDWEPVKWNLPMAVKYERKSSERLAWIPVVLTGNGKVRPIEYHGSAHIAAYPYADGIVALPVGSTIINKDEIVTVRQI